MSNPESDAATRSNWAEASATASSTGRAHRPLGRGLEDISHLFVRRTTDDPQPAQQAPPVPERDITSRSGTVVLRPSDAITREELIATLKEFPGVLDAGLRVIDEAVPCAPFSDIDLVAVDRSGQLTIADVDTFCDDDLLVRGLGHLDWVARNTGVLRRMYEGSIINYSAAPRLFLVAPRFSRLFRSAARQITRSQITCVRYIGTDSSGWAGVYFERDEDES